MMVFSKVSQATKKVMFLFWVDGEWPSAETVVTFESAGVDGPEFPPRER